MSKLQRNDVDDNDDDANTKFSSNLQTHRIVVSIQSALGIVGTMNWEPDARHTHINSNVINFVVAAVHVVPSLM